MSQNQYSNATAQPQQPRRRRYQGPVDPAAGSTEYSSAPGSYQAANHPPVQNANFAQPQQPYQANNAPAQNAGVAQPRRSYQVNDVPAQPSSFAQPQRSYQVNDVPAQNASFAQPQRNYQVNDVPAQNAALPKKPRNYQVADDADIRNAGFTDATNEEKRLIEKVNSYSDKNLFACMLLALVHCHYFYVGRKGRGLLCLCTCNFFFVGMIIDLVLMACGQFKDGQGKIVYPPMKLKAELDLQNYYRQQAAMQQR